MRRWKWPAIAAIIACLPFARGISLSNIFFVRDLTMFFWPRHVWIRETLRSGSFPVWDPYAAAGQAVFPDALNQLFLPPVLLLRLLLPAVVGFNLIVILPFPLAAWGTWLFLRRHMSGMAAAAGAVAFAVSGPVVSTANFPNLSWSIAWVPWILWAADADLRAPSRGHFAALAAFVALQIVSGEPVTMTATMALVVVYVAASAGGRGVAGRAIVRVVAAVAAGAIASTAQLVPMLIAARTSPRALMTVDNFWSLHPLWLLNALLPHVFGNSLAGYARDLPWVTPLNSGRDAFFYSLYVGPVALLLAVLGVRAAAPRWRWIWSAVIVAGLLMAFGRYTPVYVAIQRIVPVVRSFRFPVKFLLFAAFGVAMLVAAGVDAGVTQAEGDTARVGRARSTTLAAGAILLGVLVVLAALVKVVPFAGARFFYDVATRVGVRDPVAGAAFLFASVPMTTVRVLAVGLVAMLLVSLGWRSDRHAWIARAIVLTMGAVDLVVVNAGINPVFPASQLGAPEWTSALAAHPQDRFYFGGKLRGTLVPGDPDLPESGFESPPGLTAEEARMVFMYATLPSPAPWRTRELLSYDLPQLWSVYHDRAESMFHLAAHDQRLRYLANGGVRYCLVGPPPFPGAVPMRRVAEQYGSLAIYECFPNARRAFVVDRAEVVPDVDAQLVRLFDPEWDGQGALVTAVPPAPTAAAGSPAPPSARIVRDGDRRVELDVTAGVGGGYLVLRDTFDPEWRASVDGVSAVVVRANALFRAVRIPAGAHRVTFEYRPTMLYLSIAVSLMACAALVWVRRA
jgi:hypothetical protein